MKSTQRSENMNSVIKQYLDPKTELFFWPGWYKIYHFACKLWTLLFVLRCPSWWLSFSLLILVNNAFFFGWFRWPYNVWAFVCLIYLALWSTEDKKYYIVIFYWLCTVPVRYRAYTDHDVQFSFSSPFWLGFMHQVLALYWSLGLRLTLAHQALALYWAAGTRTYQH